MPKSKRETMAGISGIGNVFLNFKGKEITALAEVVPETMDLWTLLRNKKRDQIKKLYEIAKILFE